MKKIIFVIICVVTLFVGMFAGAKYTELSEQRNDVIVGQRYDVKSQQYVIKIETKDGFGRIISTKYQYSDKGLM